MISEVKWVLLWATWGIKEIPSQDCFNIYFLSKSCCHHYYTNCIDEVSYCWHLMNFVLLGAISKSGCQGVTATTPSVYREQCTLFGVVLEALPNAVKNRMYTLRHILYTYSLL